MDNIFKDRKHLPQVKGSGIGNLINRAYLVLSSSYNIYTMLSEDLNPNKMFTKGSMQILELFSLWIIAALIKVKAFPFIQHYIQRR